MTLLKWERSTQTVSVQNSKELTDYDRKDNEEDWRLQRLEDNNQDGGVCRYRTPFETNVHRVFQWVVFDFVPRVTEMYNMHTNSERCMHFCLLCKSAWNDKIHSRKGKTLDNQSIGSIYGGGDTVRNFSVRFRIGGFREHSSRPAVIDNQIDTLIKNNPWHATRDIAEILSNMRVVRNLKEILDMWLATMFRTLMIWRK